MIPVDEHTNWAAVLSDLLAMRGMTQAQLARDSGYAEGQVSKWLRGVVVPGQAAIARLLAALGWRMNLTPDDTDWRTP